MGHARLHCPSPSPSPAFVGPPLTCPLPQIVAILIESTRLLLVQVLLQDAKMNPIVSLYYFAPVCLACNLVALFPIEGLGVFGDALTKVGLPLLLFNAGCTFALNLSGVWLIGVASGLVLTLSGVVCVLSSLLLLQSSSSDEDETTARTSCS